MAGPRPPQTGKQKDHRAPGGERDLGLFCVCAYACLREACKEKRRVYMKVESYLAVGLAIRGNKKSPIHTQHAVERFASVETR